MIRVYAGRFKGRVLRTPHGRAVRPTAGRVREAIFDLLGEVVGAAVLDLFAGSGALGIEALSRGAKRAVFVERERHAVAALRDNLLALGLSFPEAEVRPVDVALAVEQARGAAEKYDLVLIDPPYAEGRRWGQVLGRSLPALLRPGGRVVVECDRRQPVALGPCPTRFRRYGGTLVQLYYTEDMLRVTQGSSEEGGGR